MPITPSKAVSAETRAQYSFQRLAIPIPEAAKRISISRAHLYREVKLGRLRTVKLGGRRLVRVVDLHAYLEANLVATNLVEGASNLDKTG